MQKLLKKQEGCTLLEPLILIVIIGILAVLIVPNLASGPKRARDSQRKSDLRNIKTALETYYNDKNGYPALATVSADLTNGGTYLKALPADPKTKAAYTYTPSPASCASGACTSYVLQATLENTKDGDIKTGTTATYEVTSAN